jgi:lipoprotein-anchoring transpeptidase ErfK/SrfK
MMARESVCAALVVLLFAGSAAALIPEEIAASPGLTLQAALDRSGFSPGEIDGRLGAVTKRALAAFQKEHGLTPTGAIDDKSWAALGVKPGEPAKTITQYSIAAEDVQGPFTSEIPEDMAAKAELPALGYTGVVEALAERFHVAPALLKALNPDAKFAAGETVSVPRVSTPPPAATTARDARGTEKAPEAVGTSGGATDVTVSVSKSAEALTVRDADDKILLFAPVTVGSEHDPLPIGRWKVKGVQRNPVFHYNPYLFWDADPSHTKASIPAGPNNPVGVVWIDLDKPHYGIHGTPEPGKIGYRESHGCVRLTNWDALKLAALVKPGTAVIFEP